MQLQLRILLICAATIAGTAVHAQTADRAERPSVQVGDSWLYEYTQFPAETKHRVTLRVREVTRDGSIITGSADNGSTFDRDWRVQQERRAGTVRFSAERVCPILDFPLEVGKRWNGDCDTTYADGWVRRTRQAEAVVEAVEKVTVPAGTFNAFRIRYQGYYAWKTAWVNTRWVQHIWYAPDVGRWVKREQVFTAFSYYNRELQELVAFTPAKANAGDADPKP